MEELHLGNLVLQSSWQYQHQHFEPETGIAVITWCPPNVRTDTLGAAPAEKINPGALIIFLINQPATLKFRCIFLICPPCLLLFFSDIHELRLSDVKNVKIFKEGSPFDGAL